MLRSAVFPVIAPSSHGRARFRSGFTLIEMVVVVTVAGIALAMGVKRSQTYMAQQRVVRAASTIQGDIDAAWAIASRNRRPVRLSWNTSTLVFSVTSRDGATIYRSSPLGSRSFGLTASEITFSSSPIEVFPSGLSSDTLLITIAATRQGQTMSRRVHVSRGGLVRID
jgi:prepilin-type N-terminal cleavage/methylation domain-containing protein